MDTAATILTVLLFLLLNFPLGTDSSSLADLTTIRLPFSHRQISTLFLFDLFLFKKIIAK
jgi:hypothetical protein